MAAPSGTTWGSIAGDRGRIGIYIGLSSTATVTTVTISTWFWSKYSVSDTNNAYYYNNEATSAATKIGSKNLQTTHNTGSGWHESNQVKLEESTYTYTYNRGTSDVVKNCAIKLTNVDWVGATMTHTRSYTIPKLDSYTVSYNANGGSGAPGNQTKWYGKTLTLSNTRPTRTGYQFQGWATSSSGSVVKQPGGSYTGNANVTYYAVWKPNTYAVTYNANGGTGAPGNQTKTYGITLKLSSEEPTRTNYEFIGWSTSSTATKATYVAGASYTTNAALKLYAVWKLAYVKPRIKTASLTRCDAVGEVDEEGKYAYVNLSFACDKSYGNIMITWSSATAESGSTTISLPQISWSDELGGYGFTTSYIFGDGNLDHESSYTVTITVDDGYGNSSVVRSLGAVNYPIDMYHDDVYGIGIGIGKPAKKPGVMDVGYVANFDKAVQGMVYGLGELPVLSDGTDLNDLQTPGVYAILGNDDASTMDNVPSVLTNTAGRVIVSSANGNIVERDDKYFYLFQEYIPINLQYPTYKRLITSDGKGNVTYSDWVPVCMNNHPVLWSGSYYMTRDHTATLTLNGQPAYVSNQPNGIVLVWVRYIDGAVNNTDFHYVFVPKHHVKNHNGKGVGSGLMCDSTASIVANKYVYVFNDRIEGHDQNSLTATMASGITKTNSGWVLCYVLGV